MKDYDLRKSFQLRKLPIPILVDQKGNIIDGLNRTRLGLECAKVVLPIENLGDIHLIRLLVNACRRDMESSEISQALAGIAENYGYNASQIAELLPFSYDWVCKYLPKQYKDKEMAKLGAKGGAASRGPLDDVKRESVSVLAKRGESKEDFVKRFGGNVESHLNQLLKKDFPIIVSHMDAEGKCDECIMASVCTKFLTLVQMETNLPKCMREKLVALC